MEAFRSLGFSEIEIDAIHDMVAAALWFGEVKFDTSTYDDGRKPVPVSIKNTDVVDQICKLLGP